MLWLNWFNLLDYKVTSRWTRITQSAFLIVRSLWALVGVSLSSFVNLYVWGVLCPHPSLNWNYGSDLSLNKMGDTAPHCVICEYLEFELICPPFFFDEVESISVWCCVRIIPRLEQTFSCLGKTTIPEQFPQRVREEENVSGITMWWAKLVVINQNHLQNMSLWMGRLVYSFLVSIVDLAFLKEVFWLSAVYADI